MSKETSKKKFDMDNTYHSREYIAVPTYSGRLRSGSFLGKSDAFSIIRHNEVFAIKGIIITRCDRILELQYRYHIVNRVKYHTSTQVRCTVLDCKQY